MKANPRGLPMLHSLCIVYLWRGDDPYLEGHSSAHVTRALRGLQASGLVEVVGEEWWLTKDGEEAAREIGDLPIAALAERGGR